jgi:hypothetical protein
MHKLKHTMHEIIANMGDDVRHGTPFLSSARTVTNSGSWISKLDKEFKTAGLVDVKIKQYPVPKAMNGYQMDLGFQTIEEASIGMDRMVGEGAGDDVRAKLAAAYEEHRLYGSSVDADMIVCVGRKEV